MKKAIKRVAAAAASLTMAASVCAGTSVLTASAAYGQGGNTGNAYSGNSRKDPAFSKVSATSIRFFISVTWALKLFNSSRSTDAA